MKREADLIRKILLHIEQQPIGVGINSLEFDNYDESVINEHVRLLKEAHYIDAMLAEGFNYQGERVVLQ